MIREPTALAVMLGAGLLFYGLLWGAITLAAGDTTMFFARNRKTTNNAPDSDPEEPEIERLRQRHGELQRDLDNYKRRMQQEIDTAVHKATEELLASFLPVGDNLDRALAIAPLHGSPQLREGLRMVRDMFLDALARHGIVSIAAIGEPFDPSVHEAIQQVDSPDHQPGVVVHEHERGYRRGARLLRAARVIVAGPRSGGKATMQACKRETGSCG